MSYRKREIGHWNQGKAYKGSRKAKERNYVKRDIVQQVAEQDEDFRYRHYSHTPNVEAQLEHRLSWYARTIEDFKRMGFMSKFVNSFRDGFSKAKKKLTELREKKNALRSQ